MRPCSLQGGRLLRLKAPYQAPYPPHVRSGASRSERKSVSVQSAGTRLRVANERAWSGPEAEAIYAQGREPVVDALLAFSARLEAQGAQLAALAERVEEL